MHPINVRNEEYKWTCRFLNFSVHSKQVNVVAFSKQSQLMKSIIFWDMRPCSPLSFNRRFGGTYRLYHQGRRNMFSKPTNKQVASCLLAGFLNLFLRPWRWRRYVPPKRRLKLNGLHGVISQMILFITTAVKTSNPTIIINFCNIKGVYLKTYLFLNATMRFIIKVKG
jgi:hypothetical protein